LSARLNRRLYERDNAFGAIVVDALQAYPAEALGLQHFDRKNDQHLARAVLAVDGQDRGFPVRDGQVGLVNLNTPLQAFAVRPHHGAAKPVQHRPSGLVASQAQHPLQTKGADALLLIGQIPSAGQPHTQWRASLVEYRASGHRRLVTATAAHQARAARPIRLGCYAAIRANESLRPPQCL
jgi:hypothetical protein